MRFRRSSFLKELVIGSCGRSSEFKGPQESIGIYRTYPSIPSILCKHLHTKSCRNLVCNIHKQGSFVFSNVLRNMYTICLLHCMCKHVYIYICRICTQHFIVAPLSVLHVWMELESHLTPAHTGTKLPNPICLERSKKFQAECTKVTKDQQCVLDPHKPTVHEHEVVFVLLQ